MLLVPSFVTRNISCQQGVVSKANAQWTNWLEKGIVLRHYDIDLLLIDLKLYGCHLHLCHIEWKYVYSEE